MFVRLSPVCSAITCKGCGVRFDFEFDFFVHHCIQPK